MDEEIKVKNEPLDYEEEMNYEGVHATAIPTKKELNDAIVKTEYSETEVSYHDNSFQIVDEGADIITVNAVESKLVDEIDFIKHAKISKPKLAIEKAPSDHTKIHCSVCQLNYVSSTYYSHIKNGECTGPKFFFCRKKCGQYFRSINHCVEHEFRYHSDRSITCSICFNDFPTCDDLLKHMELDGCGRLPKLPEPEEVCDVKLKKSQTENKLPASQEVYNVRPKKIQVSQREAKQLHEQYNVRPKKIQVSQREAKQLHEQYNVQFEVDETTNRILVPGEVYNAQPKRSKIENQILVPGEVYNGQLKRIKIENVRTVRPVRPTELFEDASLVQIKQEPIDDELILPHSTPISDVTEENEFYIKTEIEDEIDEKPVIDLREMSNGTTATTPLLQLQNPTSTSFPQIVSPVAAHPQPLAPNFVSIVRLPPPLKAAPVISAELIARKDEMAFKQGPPPLQVGVRKTFPINLKGCKILKLAPNSKIIRLPTNVKPSLANCCDKEQIKIASISDDFGSQIQLKEETKQLLGNREVIVKNTDVATAPSNISTLHRIYSQPLLTQIFNNTIEEQSFDKLVADATQQDMEKLVADATQQADADNRNLCLPTSFLKAVECLPEKKQLLQEMLERIKKAQMGVGPIMGYGSVKPGVVTITNKLRLAPKIKVANLESSAVKEAVTDNPKEAVTDNPKVSADTPAPFFVHLLEDSNEKLANVRCCYPNYRFTFSCPRCSMHYEQRHAFLSHLVSMHSMFRDDMQKLQVEVRAQEVGQRIGMSTKGFRKKSVKSEFEKVKEKLKLEKISSTNDASATGKFPCLECGRILSTRQILYDHVRGNCGRDPQYNCGICSKRFFSVSTRNCHMTIHTGVLPHKCNYCDKRFRTRGQVTVHHRTHTGERPFTCQICSQRFTHRETLISHLSRHIGMKRYKCYSCNKTFSCISGLKTHRGKRPATCGKIVLNSRAIGPRVRVVRGSVIFEPQPEINSYLRTSGPQEILSEIQNQPPQEETKAN